ncbi:MAG: T9SS type A sorting domain-containing protein [Dysgonomonas sp.]
MKKIFLLIGFTMLVVAQMWAQSVNITESAGWLESAFVKWSPVEGAESYNVYYSGEGVTNQKINDQLIRSYGTYFRADILGLKAGTYTIKVAPVLAGTEGAATTTASLTVLPYDRTGFAFANGRVPGAYKADGTPKANAVIIYVTEKTKNTVSLDVVTSSKLATTNFTGLQSILLGYKKGYDTRPLIVRLVGQITDLSNMDKGDIVVENNNNASVYITLEGVGQDAVADGWGIRLKNASNIEVRNIAVMNCNSDEGDNIGLQQSNDYVWVHNCDFFYGDAGSDADQVKGDGALDCKKSNYVTFSYNHFWDTGKSNLLGLSGETDKFYITYHHNWYDHSDSRHPRVRFYSAHVYNNYYDGVSKYGVGSTEASSVFVEGNYFRNCKYPILTSMQGSDVWNEAKQANDYKDMPIFSKEDGGSIKAYNNYMEGQKRFIAYGATGGTGFDSTKDFDAYVVTSRDETVPATVKSVYGSNVYNNFDTNSSIMYAYTPDSPTDAKGNVMTYAGRVSGGDFKWTFNNAVDDASSEVNAALKSALTNYKTSLVSIQGEGGGSSNPLVTITTTAGNKDQTVTLGSAISPVEFTAGGNAISISVEDLPAGVTSSIGSNGLVLTITGTPTAVGNYTYTVSSTDGTSSTVLEGVITVEDAGGNTSSCTKEYIQAKGINTDNAFTVAGSASSNGGTQSYEGVSLSTGLKMDSKGSIAFTTTSNGATLIVGANSKSAGGTLKLNGVESITNLGTTFSETTLTLGAAGTYTIAKGTNESYVYYVVVKEVCSGTSIEKSEKPELVLYPNPVSDNLYIVSETEVESVEVYDLSGAIIKRIKGNVESVNVSDLTVGSYLVNVHTKQGSHKQIIFKK